MNSNELFCPVCDEGVLSPRSYTGTFDFNGHFLEVENLNHYICSLCEAQPTFSDQILHNQKLIADAKRAVSGLLTADQIKYVRSFLGFTQKMAAEAFGGGVHAFSKYERGEVIQSEPMDKLLRAVLVAPEILDSLDMEFEYLKRHLGARSYGYCKASRGPNDVPGNWRIAFEALETVAPANEPLVRAWPQGFNGNSFQPITNDPEWYPNVA